METKERILEYIKDNGPVSGKEISEYVDVSMASISRAIQKLIDEGKISKVGGTRRVFYVVPDGITYAEMQDLKQILSKETAKAKDSRLDIEDRVKELTKSVNGFYANIISLMSVFVAIFALITVNANIAVSFLKDNIWDGVAAVATINGIVVFCIIVMLVFVRIIIISPLLKVEKVTEIQ